MRLTLRTFKHKKRKVSIIATCTSSWCNLITSLLPHPVCSRGTNRLWMRLLSHVRACAEIAKKAEFVSYHAVKNTPPFFADMRRSLKIFALGIPFMQMYSALHIIMIMELFSPVQMCSPRKWDVFLFYFGLFVCLFWFFEFWWIKRNVAYTSQT